MVSHGFASCCLISISYMQKWQKYTHSVLKREYKHFEKVCQKEKVEALKCTQSIKVKKILPAVSVQSQVNLIFSSAPESPCLSVLSVFSSFSSWYVFYIFSSCFVFCIVYIFYVVLVLFHPFTSFLSHFHFPMSFTYLSFSHVCIIPFTCCTSFLSYLVLHWFNLLHYFCPVTSSYIVFSCHFSLLLF